MSKLAHPKLTKIGDALKDGQLDYDTLARQLNNCGGGQQGFNLHDLVFTPAYAASGCTYTGKDGMVFSLSLE